jgi:quinol monooxygenase YgiN
VVIYEVNLEVDPEMAEAYLAWLQPHIRQVLACEGFQEAELFEIEPAGTSTRQLFSVRYSVRDRKALDAYLAGPAKALRAEGAQRFGESFAATRRIMAARASFS